MTPVLAMTVLREAAIAAFVPEKFYTVDLELTSGCTASSRHIPEKSVAENLLEACRKEMVATIQRITHKEKSESPPPLYDLTTLQRNKNMAPLTIALGPGFTAGVDVDVVIETKRGHNLGRVIREGSAYPNTGIPGIIGGYGAERVIHAPAEGLLKNKSKIGDIVEKGQVIAVIEASDKENESAADIKKTEVTATIDGLLRGLIRDNYPVTKGFKIADIDPRKEELANCFTISDKARCIAGSVLEVICEALE